MTTRLYTAALALMLTAMPSSGQELELKAGMNLSTLSGDAVIGAAREVGIELRSGRYPSGRPRFRSQPRHEFLEEGCDSDRGEE